VPKGYVYLRKKDAFRIRKEGLKCISLTGTASYRTYVYKI